MAEALPKLTKLEELSFEILGNLEFPDDWSLMKLAQNLRCLRNFVKLDVRFVELVVGDPWAIELAISFYHLKSLTKLEVYAGMFEEENEVIQSIFKLIFRFAALSIKNEF